MAKFFITKDNINKNTIILNKDDSHHLIKPLRSQVGDIVYCVDEYQVLYTTSIIKMEKLVYLNIEKKEKELTELETGIHLYQSIPNRNKLEYIIEKAVELGVNEITPVISERTNVRYKKEQLDNKLARWNKIALEAAKQSERAIVPKVNIPIKLNNYVNTGELIIVAYENEENKRVKDINYKVYDRICLFVGPEGGFTKGEIKFLENNNAIKVTLGRSILKSDTAAVSLITLVKDHFN